MKRHIGPLVSAIVLTLVVSAGVATASGLRASDRQPAANPAVQMESLRHQLDKIDRLKATEPRNQRSIFGDVRRIKNKVNQLVDAHNQLVACLGTAPVTSYYGYWYGGSGAYTTALDFTPAGGTPSTYMTTYRC